MPKKVRKIWRKLFFVFVGFVLTTSGIFYPRGTEAAPCTSSGNDVTIHADCEFSAGTYFYTGTFTVASGVTITAEGDLTNDIGVVLVSDNFHILGTISADSQGETSDGQGAGVDGGFGSGGSHGGRGGSNSTNTEYGSIFAPINIGSSGGDDTNNGGEQGGPGGGAIKLFLYGSGTITLGDGAIISADGGNATGGVDGGGGSGGSVWIDAPSGTLTVGSTNTATISADGGEGVAGDGGGGGSGGRVAIYAGTCTNCDNITTTAYGGINGTQSGTFDDGGAGSVFKKLNGATNGDVIYDNNERPTYTRTTLSASSTQTFDNITIKSAADVRIPDGFTMTLASGGAFTGGGTTQSIMYIDGGATFDSSSSTFIVDDVDIDQTGDFDGTDNLVVQDATYVFDTVTSRFINNATNRIVDLTLYTGATFSVENDDTFWIDDLLIQSGGTMTHEENSTAETHRLIVSATSTIRVNSGGSINVDEKGYQTPTSSNTAGNGPGGGGTGGFAGGGAYGGMGGHETGDDGVTYGSPTQPSNIGSSGGHDDEGNNTTVTGDGGGAVKLSINTGGVIEIDGTISADGGTIGTSVNRDHGGGSGGSIWIDAIGSTIDGTGTLSANGGRPDTNQGGGSGGGGRVAVYYATDASSWTLEAYAPAGGSQSSSTIKEGGAGTVYTKADGATNGDLVVGNDDRSSGNDTRQVGASETYDNITVKDGAKYQIPSSTTLTLASSGTFTGGGSTQPSFTIEGGGTFDSSSSTFIVNDLDVTHRGDFDGTTNLVIQDATYTSNADTLTFSNQGDNRVDNFTLYTGATYTTENDDAFYVENFLTQSGSTMAHGDNSDTHLYSLVISATSTINIQSGTTVNLDEIGYDQDEGPCKGTTGANAGGGAGHGGDGGDSGSSGEQGGSACDTVSAPTDIGSGGANDTSGTRGEPGGGYMSLTTPTSGSITIDVAVSADGGDTSTNDDAGAGAGGAVYISTGGLYGSGSIGVNGGTAHSSEGGGGGAGGRIAVYYTTDNSSLSYSATGGAGGLQNNFNGTDGGAGTIYLKDNGQANADLIVDNDTHDTSEETPQLNASETYRTFTLRDDARYEVGSGETLTVTTTFTTSTVSNNPEMIVLGGATFNPSLSASQSWSALDVTHDGEIGTITTLTYSSGTYNFNTATATYSGNTSNRLTDLTLGSSSTYSLEDGNTFWIEDLVIQSGGTLTHADNSTAETHKVDVSATNTIDVQSGGFVDVDAKGYDEQNGAGAGQTDDNEGAGGGYGGRGGKFNGSGTDGGAAYGSVTQPTNIGSGGGNDTNNGADGGDGAGAIKLVAGTTLTIAGTVSADGQDGQGSASDEPGGGSGGSVWLDGATIAGSGTVTADGGDAPGTSGNGAGGGGGRIAVYYDTDSSSWTMQAFGGADGNAAGDQEEGGAGTIYVKDNGASNANLTIKNNNLTDGADTPQLTSSETYAALTIADGAVYEVGSSETLAVASGGSFTGGGTAQSELQILSGGTFDPNLTGTQTWTSIDIDQDGTINDVTNLTLNDSTFQNNGTFAAGMTDLTLQSGSNFRQQSTTNPFSGSTLTIENGGTFTQEHTSTISVTTVTIESGGKLTHCDNSTAQSCEVDFSVTTMDLQNGGSIDVDGLGFDGGEGTGVGGDAANAGGGGGYGGAGGEGIISSVGQDNGGSTYGTQSAPTNMGSGGGDDTVAGGENGGAGGGYVTLAVSTTFTHNGTVTADGDDDDGERGGGGSGGGIYIAAGNATWAGTTGTMGANGGSAAGSDSGGGGCGGGGRIHVLYQSKTYTGSALTASAGSGCGGERAGADGTVLEEQNAPSIDTNDHSPDNPEVGDNVNFFCEASKSTGGISKIEIKQDSTIKKTCNFSPVQTPANCDISVGSLAAGSYDNVCLATDNNSVVTSATDTFSVVARTTSNKVALSNQKVSTTDVTATITMTFAASSSGSLTVTWPSGFTVTGAATDAASDDCFSSFGSTATTMTATKTNCSGTVQFGGGKVTNPSSAGQYHITWTNDDGGATVVIVDEGDFNITASVDPSITFYMGSQAAASTCDGTFTGNGGTVALGTLTTGAVASSDVSSVNHICVRGSTNASSGAVITVQSANAALKSTSTPADTIDSSTATLTAGTEGYGLCVGSGGSDTGIDTTTPTGASVTRSSPFDGTCTTSGHAVGAVTTSPQNLWTVSGPVQNAFGRVYVKAAIDGTIIAHDDYTDTLTFIMTATY